MSSAGIYSFAFNHLAGNNLLLIYLLVKTKAKTDSWHLNAFEGEYWRLLK